MVSCGHRRRGRYLRGPVPIRSEEEQEVDHGLGGELGRVVQCRETLKTVLSGLTIEYLSGRQCDQIWQHFENLAGS